MSTSSSALKSALEDWRSTCTVPPYPKRCPECRTKVKLYHTPENKAAFMCSNIGKVNKNNNNHNNHGNDNNKNKGVNKFEIGYSRAIK
jgi:hypothetical protein